MNDYLLISAAVLGGCGGAVSAQGGVSGSSWQGGVDASDVPSDGASEVVGIGPIDASGLPVELPMKCEGKAAQISLKLPCALGQNVAGPATMKPGLHVLECELAGASGHPATSLMIPLELLPELLNQPVHLPFENIPSPPPGYYGFDLAGEMFAGVLVGTAVFSQVDPIARAFVARLADAKIDWVGNQGGSISCSATDQPFWAVPGGFL